MEMCKDIDKVTQMHQLLNSECTNRCPAIVVPGEVEQWHTSAVYYALGDRLLTDTRVLQRGASGTDSFLEILLFMY